MRVLKEKNDEELAAQQRLEEEKANLEAEEQRQKKSDNVVRAAGAGKGGNEGEDVENPEVAVEEEDFGDNETGTLVKKMKKSSKSDNRKERKPTRKGNDSTEKSTLKKGKKRDQSSKDKGEDPIEATGGSALRTGRFSLAGETPEMDDGGVSR